MKNPLTNNIYLLGKEQVKASLYTSLEVQLYVPRVVPSRHTQDGPKVSSDEHQPAADEMCGWPAGPTQVDQSDSTLPIG